MPLFPGYSVKSCPEWRRTWFTDKGPKLKSSSIVHIFWYSKRFGWFIGENITEALWRSWWSSSRWLPTSCSFWPFWGAGEHLATASFCFVNIILSTNKHEIRVSWADIFFIVSYFFQYLNLFFIFDLMCFSSYQNEMDKCGGKFAKPFSWRLFQLSNYKRLL